MALFFLAACGSSLAVALGVAGVCENCRVVAANDCYVGAIQSFGDGLVAVACTSRRVGEVEVYSRADGGLRQRVGFSPGPSNHSFAAIGDGRFAVPGGIDGRSGVLVLSYDREIRRDVYFADDYLEHRLQRIGLITGSNCIVFSSTTRYQPNVDYRLTILNNRGQLIEHRSVASDPYIQFGCVGPLEEPQIWLLPHSEAEKAAITRAAHTAGVPVEFQCIAVEQWLLGARRDVRANCISGPTSLFGGRSYQVSLSSALEEASDYRVDLVIEGLYCVMNAPLVANGGILFGVDVEDGCEVSLSRDGAVQPLVRVLPDRETSDTALVAEMAPCVTNPSEDCVLFAHVGDPYANVYEATIDQ